LSLLEILPVRLQAEPGRVVIRPFQIAPEPRSLHPTQTSRAHRIVRAVLDMDMRTCQSELALVNLDFSQRHWQTRRVFMERFEQVRAELELPELDLDEELRDERKELIGHEYSFTSAALMNPSVVPHPDQTGMTGGALRVVVSLRAVGEGHISSICFREGILNPQGGFDLMPRPPFSVAVSQTDKPTEQNGMVTTAERFSEASLSGTVIFPFTPQQRNGLEDLRLVKLEDDEGPLYCGTYTAYSGFNIASELLVTRDFKTFALKPMTGAAARNKGMAIFPKKIGGKYAVIGRQDGENLFFLTSDNLLHWDGGSLLLSPLYPWELVQIGNCGSPVEIDEGWLLLIHGVGAMRKYSIGAVLLDKEDPRKVLARSVQPILSPSDEDREGYVPNVVYTCGALAHGRRLFMPYGVADSSVGFSFIDLDQLLASMQ
jgi:predicted GH43/DUF377 family glycosyl hydrolase